MTLSIQAKEAIKTGLAMVIAFGIALWMDWEKPYWAGFAVAFISLDTFGASFNKAAMRMLGTLVAITAAFTFLALFPQQRWLFTAVVSLYVGLCAYMMTGKKRQYFWYASGFICVVISVDSSNSLTAFQIAVERAQETGTGILVYSLISVLLWPRGSQGAFEDTSRKLWETQARLYRTYRGLMSGKGKAEDSGPLRLQEVQLRTRFGQLLNAAETDSYEVWESRHQWRHFNQLSTTLKETLDRWRDSFPQIRDLDLTKPLPNLDSFSVEIDRRFTEIEHMLAGQAPAHLPEAIALKVDRTEIGAFGHFQKAAIAFVKTQLDRLEALSRALLECVRNLKGFGGPSLKLSRGKIPRRGHTIDPDRFQGTITVMATFWIAFLIWVYVNPPGHASFIMMSTVLTMVAVRTGVSATAMALPLILGTLFAGILYVFVMPHLSGYGQLGLMIFVVTFGITYLFSAPRQALVKLIALAMFANHISVQNQQNYSFASFMNSLAMTCLVAALIIATAYIPPSPRPEKAFLRLLRRFFRHAELLMSCLALDQDKQNGLTIRWRMVFYRADFREIPAKLAALGQRIDYRRLSGQTPDQIRALVASLQVLSYRMQDLIEACASPQSDLLVRELFDDVRAWDVKAQETFERLAEEQDAGKKETFRARLDEITNHLQQRIEETLDKAAERQLSDGRDGENFYRLLGAYRGVSEALVEYAGSAGIVDWARWREERF